VAHQRGLAGTQVAAQLDKRLAQRRLGRQRNGKLLRGGLTGPDGGFYNRQVNRISTHGEGSRWVSRIQDWGRALGFSQIGIAGVDLTSAEPGLSAWLAQGFHGDMAYMAAHGLKRARPAELLPGTVSVISARMNYLPADTLPDWRSAELARLQHPQEGVVSLYARGRNYHKVLRSRLQRLSEQIAAELNPLGFRVFCDSAPVLEVELASRSGLGWRGKHTLLLNRQGGSMFFLGEIFVDVVLPPTGGAELDGGKQVGAGHHAVLGGHCGACTRCLAVCPTQAIVAPYRLDARRCISYLTIEHAGPIPLALRPLMGNHIYGCDDCQLVCPWNKFAKRSVLPDFDARDGLAGSSLVALFGWTEAEFLRRTEGSPIRRIGHECWLRNMAVALGNAVRGTASAQLRQPLLQALRSRVEHPSALVREHVAWALRENDDSPTLTLSKPC